MSSRFNFDWVEEVIDPSTIDLSQYDLVHIPKENIPLLDDRCKVCIHKHVNKYKGFLDSNGNYAGNKFLIRCQGILKNPVPQEVREALVGDQKTLEIAEEIYSPIQWAAHHLKLPSGQPWHARYYQDLMVRCTAQRKVSRLGRRCLAEDTLVWTNKGKIPIADIVIGDTIIAFDLLSRKLVESRVINVYDQGLRETLSLHFANKEVYCTRDHKWLCQLKSLNSPFIFSIESMTSDYSFCEATSNGMRLVPFPRISSFSIQHCYDIEIDHPDHLFIIEDGLISHNSGKSDSVAVTAIYTAITNPFMVRDPLTGAPVLDKNGQVYQKPSKILAITPRQTHSDNLAQKIVDFCHSDPDLESCVDHKKSPYHLFEFKNGSRITVLTAGAGTATSGLSARSFDADLLILDEANYLDEDTVKAVMAILGTDVVCMLWALSTPVGTKDFFWNWCFAEPSYREFHYPTSCVPHWSLIKDQIMSDCQTEDEFLHEWMADFSAAAQGVFRIDLVEKAAQPYIYNDVVPEGDMIYSIGVDWNTTIGTELYVIGYSKLMDKWIGVEAVNIPKAKWTQLMATDRLIDLIHKWDPAYVYVDAGHGGTQIELLQLASTRAKAMGHHNHIAKIQDILHVYDFGSKITLRHPTTGVVIQKAAKPYLVNNTIRRFEEERIIFPMADNILYSQLSHYVIDHVTPTGLPVYKASKASVGDHRLDAFMLALVGYSLEDSILSNRIQAVSDIGIVTAEEMRDYRARAGMAGSETIVKPISRTSALQADPVSYIGPRGEIIKEYTYEEWANRDNPIRNVTGSPNRPQRRSN